VTLGMRRRRHRTEMGESLCRPHTIQHHRPAGRGRGAGMPSPCSRSA
jgi:hypothetical protein